MIDEDRLCKHFLNLNYNLYLNEPDPKCQQNDEADRINQKIEARMKKCEDELFKIFRGSNNL
jgi:hypothetical protein